MLVNEPRDTWLSTLERSWSKVKPHWSRTAQVSCGSLATQCQEECRKPWTSDQPRVKTWTLYRLSRVPFYNQASLIDCFRRTEGEAYSGRQSILARLDRVAPDPTVSHTDRGPALWLSFHLHDVKLAFSFFNSSFIVKLIWEILHSTFPAYRFRLDVPRKTSESVVVKRPICV